MGDKNNPEVIGDFRNRTHLVDCGEVNIQLTHMREYLNGTVFKYNADEYVDQQYDIVLPDVKTKLVKSVDVYGFKHSPLNEYILIPEADVTFKKTHGGLKVTVHYPGGGAGITDICDLDDRDETILDLSFNILLGINYVDVSKR